MSTPMLKMVPKSSPIPSRPRKGPMTVCTSALAAEEKAIVCMADKALSYGDTIPWDSDSSKMFALSNEALVIMFAGSEEPTSGRKPEGP